MVGEPVARTVWPPFITGTEWTTVWQSAFSAARAKRGAGTAPDGSTMVPRITNGEAVALVRAWRDAAGSARFPLAAQFAGQAYGWNPSKGDRLITTSAQRDKLMSTAITHELWFALYKLASDFDDERPPTVARVDFDAEAFGDPVYQASVRAGLALDGAKREIVRVTRAKPGAPQRRPSRAPSSSSSSSSPVLVLGALWLLFGNKKPRRYRRTHR
jgi:hypothetical protein